MLLSFTVALQAHAIDSLTILSGTSPKKIQIRGEAGRDYVIQGSSDLSAANGWEILEQLTLPQAMVEWIDMGSTGKPQRFYRMSKVPLSDHPLTATNFRLLDQQGKSTELQYYSNERVIVLIFSDDYCAGTEEIVPTIKKLRDQFSSQGWLFL